MRYFFLFLFVCSFAFAQSNYVPKEDNIINFLDRLAMKGLIKINDEFKPYTRQVISSKLIELKNKRSELNALELQELEIGRAHV
mgnify:CR=1 FL=1